MLKDFIKNMLVHSLNDSGTSVITFYDGERYAHLISCDGFEVDRFEAGDFSGNASTILSMMKDSGIHASLEITKDGSQNIATFKALAS